MRVAAAFLSAHHGVDGALPRRHAPRFPSGARLPGQNSDHHVPLIVWSAAVLSRCAGTLFEKHVLLQQRAYFRSALLQTLQFTRLQKLTCTGFHNQHPPRATGSPRPEPEPPIYLKEITVNKLFTAVTSSRDSSPRLVIGRRARDHPGPVGGAPGDPRVGTAGGHMKVG